MSATIETLPSGAIRLQCFNPATGKPLGELEAHNLEAVDQALQRLRQAAAGYNHAPVSERVRLVRRFRKALAANLDRLVESISSETGKTAQEGQLEVFAALELIRFGERAAPATFRRQYRSTGVLVHKRAYVDFRPYGVAAVISPWNYPLVLVASPVVEALLAGNVVAAKPSEYTSLTALVTKEIFDEATGRPELFEVILGASQVGERLVSSPLTDVACFIGSTRVGKIIAGACAQQLKPLILELGGNDAMIVLEDANLRRAARAAVWGGFTNAGQSCHAVERVYVVAAVFEEFLRLVRVEAGQLATDNQSDAGMGPLTVAAQYEKVSEHLQDAEKKGAEAETFAATENRPEWFIAPTLVTGVDHSMRIMTEETFGPELAVMPVASAGEAVQKANDSRFGLSAYIFTGSERRGRRLARQLACGTVVLNDVLVQFGMAAVPFGGFRDSGMGKLHGREGLLSFTRQQSVVESRVRLPMEPWWYGMGQKSYGLMRRFLRRWYG